MAFIVGSVLIGAGASIGGAALSSSASKKAAKTAAAGSAQEIAFNRESRDLARADQQPYREAGVTALDALLSMTGLPGRVGEAEPQKRNIVNRAEERDFARSNSQDVMGGADRRSSYARYAGGPMGSNNVYNVSEMGPENVYARGSMTRPRNPVTIDGQTGYVEPNIQGRAMGGPMDEGGVLGGMYRPPGAVGGPKVGPQANPGIAAGGVMENPGGQEGGYNFMTDPGYNFRMDEGQRVLERGAAARGGLLSGGFARKAIRYGQDYASNEYTNVYNRIANIAGLGQTSANTSGNAALMAGQNMGTAAAQGGYAQAAGQQAAGNAWANAGNQIAQMPWDKIFGEKD